MFTKNKRCSVFPPPLVGVYKKRPGDRRALVGLAGKSIDSRLNPFGGSNLNEIDRLWVLGVSRENIGCFISSRRRKS